MRHQRPQDRLPFEEARDDGAPQIVYYDQGVGTGNLTDRIGGGAFGKGLTGNIHDAYRFLIANYEPGDAIYIFGFSRGAYTARSIAGMIRRCGILRRDQVRKYPRAKGVYRTARRPAIRRPCSFAGDGDRARHPHPMCRRLGHGRRPRHSAARVRQQEQEGLRVPRYLAQSSIHFAFHALAVDELRKPFEPTLWDTAPAPGQTVQQAWFAGVHSDVGGGYPETGLSDHALLWMIESAKTAGLEFDDAVMKELGTHENHKQMPEHDSRKGVYNLQPALHRPIGTTPHKTEYFHRSLLERWRDLPAYRPKSLQPHAARINTLLSSPLTEPIYPV